jgi:anti-anti-sigma factor
MATETLNIAIEPLDGETVVVRPFGRVDLMTAADLRWLLATELLAGRRWLVVDLGAACFLDSTGLGALVMCWKAARGVGGELRLARPSAAVRFLLERTSLDQVLRAYDTVEQALAGENHRRAPEAG